MSKASESRFKLQWFVITALSLVALCIYLFVSAPAPLPDEVFSGTKIHVNEMFKILNAENQAVRAKWTVTVSEGKKAGLKFDERWKEEGVDAGPLPALFLRETATSLAHSPTLLRLFLGSDFPIVASNRLEGVQKEKLAEIRKSKSPQFFFDPGTKQYMAMFPDYAVSAGCVDCHNQHPNSPKTDWVLNDIMGATTWSFPKEYVNTEDVLKNVSYLRNGFKAAYGLYLKKVTTFANKPEIGDKWPGEGFFMPKLELFVQTYEGKNSPGTIMEITKLIENERAGEKKTKERGAASL